MSLGISRPETAGRRGWLRPRATGGGRQSAALAVIALGALLVSLTQSLLIPVLPTLTADLHTTSTNAEWLLTSALMAGAGAVPGIGRPAGLYGKKKLLLVSLAAFTGGSLLCALTSNLALLLVGRAVTGLSIAAIPLGIS